MKLWILAVVALAASATNNVVVPFKYGDGGCTNWANVYDWNPICELCSEDMCLQLCSQRDDCQYVAWGAHYANKCFRLTGSCNMESSPNWQHQWKLHKIEIASYKVCIELKYSIAGGSSGSFDVESKRGSSYSKGVSAYTKTTMNKDIQANFRFALENLLDLSDHYKQILSSITNEASDSMQETRLTVHFDKPCYIYQASVTTTYDNHMTVHQHGALFQDSAPLEEKLAPTLAPNDDGTALHQKVLPFCRTLKVEEVKVKKFKWEDPGV